MRSKRANDAVEAAEEADEIEAIRRGTYEGAPGDVHPPSNKVCFTIRGQEIDVDPEQLFALAQKNAAGDDYLREARAMLDAAKAWGSSPAGAISRARAR
jgi:hypothetical protein